MSRRESRLGTGSGILFALRAVLVFLAGLELLADALYLTAALRDPSQALGGQARADGSMPRAKRRAARPKRLETDYLRMRLATNLRETSMRTFSSEVDTTELGFSTTPLVEGGKGPRIACLGDSVTFGWAASRDDVE